MKCVEVYKELYHQEPFDVAFCPYRISPLGAHIDHQYGKINGLAIDKGIHMAYHPKQNGVVELQSLNFPKRAQFFVSAVPEEKQGDWADHLRGAAKMLGEKYRLKVGLSGIIEGSLPIGGLSSSASVIICFLSALCKVNGIHLEPMEMILTAKAAENQYVGVSCGKLDQSCEVLSKKNHLLYLDTKDDSYELIPTSEKMKPYKVAIFFSGLERSLKNSKYNLRQDECKAAAYALMGYAGMDYDTFANARLRDVPFEVFEAYKERLPELWRRRAEHYYSEFARAEKGAELWRKGDLEGYGQLVFESGKSSIYSYECGCDELKKLYEIMTDTDGIYGGRFSGAGFKGCCMALIDPDKAEDIEAKVTAEYLKAFPALEGKYSFHLCESADGVTENFPKPLLKVGEKSILDWLVDDLVDTTNIDEFVVISNHKFAQHFEDWKSNKQKTRPYEITVIDDGTSTNETRLGAVKDIQLAVEKLNLADDLLVMAGDNVLDFSLSKFVEFAKEKNTSCVMCHEENELKKQQKTAIITLDGNDLITSYEEKPKEPKGNLAVPPFYCYRACDVKRIQEALNNGCGYDAPGSFAAWLSKQTPMHAYVMPGKRYDIGDINSYEYVKSVFSK